MRKTQLLLQRSVNIYNNLKNVKFTNNFQTFKLIHEATVVTVNNKAERDKNANNANDSTNDSDVTHTKRLHQETTIQPFTEKHPLNEQE